jgi:hypothetical protein
VSVQDKDVKTATKTSAPPPTAETVVGVPSLPAKQALDLDLEELSGSLLVEEAHGRATKVVDEVAPRPRSVPPPLPPSASSRPPPPLPVASLPKINPPPRHEPPALARSGPPTSAPDTARTEKLEPVDVREGTARTEKLEPVDMVEVTFAADEPAQEPAPAVPPLAQLPTAVPPAVPEPSLPPRGAFSSPLADDIELTTLPRGVLSPLPVIPVSPGRARSASGMPPSGEPSQPARGRTRRPFAALAGVAAGVTLAIVAVAAIRHHDRAPATSASAASSAPPTTSAGAAERAPAAPESSAAPAACALAGDPRVIAPSAIVAPGIEVRTLGGEIALGFASGDHHAVLARLDPSSWSASASTTKGWAGVVRRATPVLSKRGKLALAVDVDRKGDTLRGRRTLQLDPALQVGVADAHLAWAPLRRRVAGKLWALDGDDAVEAVRGVQWDSTPSKVAIAFRSAGGIWIGQAESADASLVPRSDLSRVGTRGSMVGAPAVAANAGVVLVAWAERQSADEPWRLRWVRFKEGEAPGPESTFAPPPGGHGEQAMSPGLAVVPGGRFLLVWTEGPASAHEVRALTLSADGKPVGMPLSISSAGTNAGQGQAAVATNGRGVVAFLEASANGFQLVATPIACTL